MGDKMFLKALKSEGDKRVDARNSCISINKMDILVILL